MEADRQRLNEAVDKIDQVNLTQQNQMATNLEYNKNREKYQEIIENQCQEIDALKTRMAQVEGYLGVHEERENRIAKYLERLDVLLPMEGQTVIGAFKLSRRRWMT